MTPARGQASPGLHESPYGALPKPSTRQADAPPASRAAASDTPVILLAWLLFVATLCPVGLPHNQVLGALAFAWSASLSMILTVLSWARGWQWRLYGAACIASSMSGLALGLLLRLRFPVKPLDGYLAIDRDGAALCGATAAASLIFSLVLCWALPCLGLRIVGGSTSFAGEHGWGWHPEVAAEMLFGGGSGERRPLTGGGDMQQEQVVATLLSRRCYWSGEPAYDYAFHIANEHTFLGCVFSHPSSPYNRCERILVLAIVAMLIVFPCAAFSLLFDDWNLRMAWQLVLVTVPRNALKLYLRHIAGKADSIVLMKSGRAEPKARATEEWYQRWELAASSLQAADALWFQGVFFASMVIFSTSVCWLSSLYVLSRGRSLGWTLAENCIGLGFAFVLDLILDMLLMYRAQRGEPEGRRGCWHLGFWGRWLQERDEYIAKQKEPAAVPVAV